MTLDGDHTSRTASARRLDFLDALRGIAAALVVLHHAYQTSPFLVDAVRFSPFRVLLNGRSSVIFFFVLSGFVLAYGVWSRTQPEHYVLFVARRIARIYLPYAAAGLIAIAIMVSVHPVALTETAITFNAMWTPAIRADTALSHLLLLGDRDGISINVPSWSLVYEMRASLLIPLLCALCRHSRWQLIAVTAVCYGLAAIALERTGVGPVPYFADGLLENLAVTIHFTACFVIGLLLAYRLLEQPVPPTGLRRWQMAGGWLVAICLLLIFRDETAMTGSALIIVLTLHSRRFQAFLQRPLLLYLGKISFSLYLTHMIVLEVIVRVLAGHIPLRLSILIAINAAVPVASALFYGIEKPAHDLSKWIGRRYRTTIPRGASHMSSTIAVPGERK